MIGRLNHVAIAVPDLAAATKVYRDTLGAKVSPAVDQPEHGVTTVFIELPNTKVELLGVLGQGDPKIGAHGKPVLFLHPKDFCGTLVELEQA
jgi:methylmalonyl-CoA/ethylmalonyl-CoA epimerase